MPRNNIKAPEPFGSLIDDVCAKDRCWFEKHPGEVSYHRDFVSGEDYPFDFGRVLYVRVTQVAVGVRTRQFFGPDGAIGHGSQFVALRPEAIEAI